MVIFMPYYRRPTHAISSRSRTSASGSSVSSVHGQTVAFESDWSYSGCKFLSKIICRFSFSCFLLLIALFLFGSSGAAKNDHEGGKIVAIILLTVGLALILRTCQTCRRYCIIMRTRRRFLERLRSRREIIELSGNSGLSAGLAVDLPNYKDLFPSETRINPRSNESPPTYDDFIKTSNIRPVQRTEISRVFWISDRNDIDTGQPEQNAITYV